MTAVFKSDGQADQRNQVIRYSFCIFNKISLSYTYYCKILLTHRGSLIFTGQTCDLFNCYLCCVKPSMHELLAVVKMQKEQDCLSDYRQMRANANSINTATSISYKETQTYNVL